MKPRKSFPLRIEPKLYEALEAWAQQEMRSVNSQIEYLLKQAVARRAGRHEPPAATSPGTAKLPPRSRS